MISVFIPGYDEEVVGLSLVHCGRRQNEDRPAGGELAVLVHIAIDQKIDEIRSDAAIVQKRFALAWRAIADNVPRFLASMRKERSLRLVSSACPRSRYTEYLIVNNGSTDRSLEITLDYAGKDNRIRIARLVELNTCDGNEEQGLGASLPKAACRVWLNRHVDFARARNS
jgi:cellulose synthase/poly-beta-1,6-N-acetylglucosamine synthase-like glycosyltransferase